MSQSVTASHVEFFLNGRATQAAVSPQTTLLEFVRAQGLTGAKEGCAEGECGACAVAMVTNEKGRTAYRVVNSCLLFVPMVANQDIYTIESLASRGELADVQLAMAKGGGSQCGYCTPGFVMSLFAEQYRPDREGPCDVDALAGNLCRCTGYRPIRDAAAAIGPAPPGYFRDRQRRPAPSLARIDLDGFSRPGSLDECLSLLASDPDAKVIAGGSDLGVESNLAGRRWRHLVSIEAIEDLRECSETNTSVRLGAALPLTDLGSRWNTAPEVVRQWLALFASPLIRNRATLGGNLATGSPIGDAAPLLLALDATVHVAGRNGSRIIPVSSFFVGYRRTAIGPGEIVTTIEIPKPLPRVVRFYKVAKRRLDDISTVTAAMSLDRNPGGRILRARFAFGGVAATPLRLVEAEDAVVDRPWNEATVDQVQRILDRRLAPLSDHRGSREYRLEVSKSLVAKFWWETRA
jgi:xanthine dehydrogenase small subunit